MTTQENAEAQAEPTTIAELQADIEATRARLGDTVDELSQRLDVKAQAKERAQQTKTRVQELARQRQVQAAAGGAVALGVGVAVIKRRKG